MQEVKINSGKTHVMTTGNREVNFQGTYIYELDSTTFANGDDLPNDGNIHVNASDGGWISAKTISSGSKFVDIYLAQGVHPYIFKAVKASTAGTPVLAVTDFLIVV